MRRRLWQSTPIRSASMRRRLRSGLEGRRRQAVARPPPATTRRGSSRRRSSSCLDDADLEALNALLPWHCFTVDRRGRPFGRPAWSGKRDAPEQIPDPRIELFDERFGLGGQPRPGGRLLRGHPHDRAVRSRRPRDGDRRADRERRQDDRPLLDVRPPSDGADLRPRAARAPPRDWLQADLCHHVGVLYHLTDPVRHLRQLGTWIDRGLMLDTHYSEPESTDGRLRGRRRALPFKRFGERRADPFSGMESHAKWLTLDDITGCCAAPASTAWRSWSAVRSATARACCCSPRSPARRRSPRADASRRARAVGLRRTLNGFIPAWLSRLTPMRVARLVR